MAKLFDSIQAFKPKRNKFDLSHDKKLSLVMGNLVPIMCQEVLPGDSFRVNTEIMLRFAPLLAPIMHRVNVRTEYFFVPSRLVWKEFKDFITGGRLGTSVPVHPYLTPLDVGFVAGGVGSLWDYFGLPIVPSSLIDSTGQKVSALPFRAYQLIYDEYYRDQNITPPVTDFASFLDSGQVTGSPKDVIVAMRKRAWEKDYFTSALPFAQRGAAVGVPFGASGITYRPQTLLYDNAVPAVEPAGAISALGSAQVGPAGQNAAEINTPGKNGLVIDNISAITPTGTINDLRRAVKLEQWLEAMARGGARYIEQIRNIFGIISSDARLQRPEYLGGSRQPVTISEVLQTTQEYNAASPIGNPVGNMAGHGVSYGASAGFKRSFEEHGHVIGVMSILPRTGYHQGIGREWQRFDKFDYFWPQFAQIGEQEVRTKEVFYNGTLSGATPDSVFGYQSRYAEYKYGCNSTHGEFRTNLNYWHMNRVFAAQPVLNAGFIEADPTTRIFAVPAAPQHLYCQLFHKVDALRPIPYFNTPTL